MIGPVRSRAILLFAVSLLLVAGCGGSSRREMPRSSTRAGIHKIHHVIVIMQENRSFDHYFGTYPGADGIPRRNGKFTVCVPDSYLNRCIKPYHDHARRNIGGTHDHVDALGDVDNGRMDGFITQARRALKNGCEARPRSALCKAGHGPDVMGYHDWREIPNYWAYARHFVLQDHMFEPDSSWSAARPPLHGLRVVGPLQQAR